MAMESLGIKGNFFHIYDFRVKAGMGEKFIEITTVRLKSE